MIDRYCGKALGIAEIETHGDGAKKEQANLLVAEERDVPSGYSEWADTYGAYLGSSDEMGFVINHVHLHSDYLRAFRQAGLNAVQCLEPLWGGKEIAIFGFADQMPDLVEAAVEGLPIIVVWELEKS